MKLTRPILDYHRTIDDYLLPGNLEMPHALGGHLAYKQMKHRDLGVDHPPKTEASATVSTHERIEHAELPTSGLTIFARTEEGEGAPDNEQALDQYRQCSRLCTWCPRVYCDRRLWFLSCLQGELHRTEGNCRNACHGYHGETVPSTAKNIHTGLKANSHFHFHTRNDAIHTIFRQRQVQYGRTFASITGVGAFGTIPTMMHFGMWMHGR
jgi:hypothetical protein